MDNIYLIQGAKIVNDGQVVEGHVLVRDGKIDQVITDGNIPKIDAEVIDAKGKYLIPGVIDDQVHFREPGLTHKADLFTESRAAIAGGITSFMEMPNTNPQTLTQELLEQKYQFAAAKSMANYSFLMGVSNTNLDEVFKTDKRKVAGLKVFMGSSTGNMLVDDKHVLEELFKNAGMIIAAHCEDEATIKHNTEVYRKKYGENVPISCHPEIRSAEACYKSSATAAELAHKFGAHLHLFHLSTAKELDLLDNTIPLEQKNVTGEVCVHHLWFNNTDYEKYGTRIKWNPAVKYKEDQQALFEGVLNDKLDVIATDHAPHTLLEKDNTYFKAPSGGPLVQSSLQAMLDFYHQGNISLERIVEKMCHAPARLFQIENRGYIRPGYWADLVLVDLEKKYTVDKLNILYKCGWSPFEGHTFNSSITHTFVNGQLAYREGVFNESVRGDRLLFNR